jgi:hypothetical protein
MPAPASSSGRSSRVRTVAIVAALVAVGVAASGRSVQTPAQPPAAQPPAAPVVADSTMADSTAQVDTMAMTDSAMMTAVAAPAPVAEPVAPATWPVDPATGQTLINGKPVRGRVFIMQKVDGLTKYENVAQVVSREALAAEPAIVGTRHAAAPAAYTRRQRTVMTQATLWDYDTKRSAVERRHFRTATPAQPQ